MHLWETEEGLTGQVVYNPDRFDADRVVRMIGHYCRLLEGAARNPDRRLSELPLLDEQEADQLLVEWNQTAQARIRRKSVSRRYLIDGLSGNRSPSQWSARIRSSVTESLKSVPTNWPAICERAESVLDRG